MSEWKPIETAPKDGTNVLVFSNGGVFTSGQHDGEWYFGLAVDGFMKISLLLNPTHWMPLPTPPEK